MARCCARSVTSRQATRSRRGSPTAASRAWFARRGGRAVAEKKTAGYEEKAKRLDEILERLDDSQTPIDELARDVKEGAQLIRELGQKLNEVETEVRDAFQELDASAPAPAGEEDG
ncbi:MAG: exodeoxyribonuclease VII small subunit [Deltaproteobacteria bacterium]|nr:exodeoxyribonuclease VII small subunit [Deltaproteobacteria bacterium]